jgi:hypothetical protein
MSFAKTTASTLQPLNDLAVSLKASKSSDWVMEAALIALLSTKASARSESQPGNQSPYHQNLVTIGRALHDLAAIQPSLFYRHLS